MKTVPGTIIVSNEEFERKWHRFERIVWVVLSALLIAAVLGALGNGRITQQKVTSADGLLTVAYSSVIRMNANSLIEVTAERQATQQGEVRLALGGSLLKETPLQSTLPYPAGIQAGGKWSKLTYRTESGEPARVQITQRAESPGRVTWTVALENGGHVTASQWVLP